MELQHEPAHLERTHLEPLRRLVLPVQGDNFDEVHGHLYDLHILDNFLDLLSVPREVECDADG